MYTYDIFCFGLDYLKEEELSDLLSHNELDFEYNNFKISPQKHSGIVNTPYIIGKEIATNEDDDYIKKIQSSKENYYQEDYFKFIKEFENMLLREDIEGKDKIITLIRTNKPYFYIIEVTI